MAKHNKVKENVIHGLFFFNGLLVVGLLVGIFAILVMTGEDETTSGDMRARQNVVHEAGLFQGKLGFNRAIVLVENGVETFSNISGIQQIRFEPEQIRSTFGDILATLHREFDDKDA
jgi:predicted nucleotide-binding protein